MAKMMLWPATLAVAILACGDSSEPTDPGEFDSGTDASPVDAGADANVQADAAEEDAALPPCTGTTVRCGAACVDLAADGANCGACGHACGGCSANTCTKGVCDPAVLASAQSAPVELEIHAGKLYWGNDASPDVSIVPADGSVAASVFLPGRTAVRGIAFDATNIYLARSNFNMVEAVLLLDPTNWRSYTNMREPGATGITVDVATQDVYWASSGDAVIRTKSNATGIVKTLATDQPGAVDVAFDAANLYWTSSGGRVMRMPRAGGTPVELAKDQRAPHTIAVAGGFVYWNSRGDAPGNGSVNRVPVAGGAITTLASGSPSKLALDGTHVYFTESATGKVLKAPLAGGPAVVLAQDQAAPVGITVDASCVYFANYAAGAVGAGSIRRVGLQ